MKENGDMIIAAEREIVAALVPLIGKENAIKVADVVAVKLRNEYGGDHHYVRDPNSPHIRNRQIIRDWLAQKKAGSENRKLLAKKYGVSQQAISRIIANYLARLKPQNISFGSDTWIL